jgi:hypothetical protein
MKAIKSTSVSDDEVRVLLDRYKCPVVRTRFLGNIASPVMSASPIETVRGLWGGQLPPFDDINAANELIGALVMGLWNRLTRHQERSVPSRLLCFDVPETSEGLHRFVLTRRQELDGFVEGLFGKQEHIDLPERAHRALNSLSEMRAMLEGIRLLMEDKKTGAHSEITEIIHNLRELTKIAEHEMHEAVKREFKRRAGIEPVIGHLKEHHRSRNYLAHASGDAINAVLAAAGYNFRRLLAWLRRLLLGFLIALGRAAQPKSA